MENHDVLYDCYQDAPERDDEADLADALNDEAWLDNRLKAECDFGLFQARYMARVLDLVNPYFRVKP